MSPAAVVIGALRVKTKDGSKHVFVEKYGKFSLTYPCYPWNTLTLFRPDTVPILGTNADSTDPVQTL